MSQFTTPLEGIISDDGNHIELIAPFEYHKGSYPSNDIIIVPIGFKSDFASVPSALQWLVPKQGKYSKAAVLHDYLYANAIKTKQYADETFYEAMGVLGVPHIKRWVLYTAVKYFGKGKYG